jgi:hypothetical protein
MDAQAHRRENGSGFGHGCVGKRRSSVRRRREAAVAQFGEGVGRQDMGGQGGGPDGICQVRPEREVLVSEGFRCGCSHRQGKHATATRQTHENTT